MKFSDYCKAVSALTPTGHVAKMTAINNYFFPIIYNGKICLMACNTDENPANIDNWVDADASAFDDEVQAAFDQWLANPVTDIVTLPNEIPLQS